MMKYRQDKIDSFCNSDSQTVFFVFCLWSFVLICRPQDYIVDLLAFRPGMSSTLLMLVMLVLNHDKLDKPRFFQETQIRYYSILVMLMIAGIPTAIYTRLSFNTVFTEYVVVVAYFFIFYKVVNTLSRLKRVLLVSCLGSGVYFVFTMLYGTIVSGRLFYDVHMYDPNDLAYFALAFLPLNLLFLSLNNSFFIRMLCLCSFGASVLVVLLSGSRGGFLAFVMALIVMFVKTRAFKTYIKFVVVTLCLALLVFVPINFERYSTILDLENDYNMHAEEGRLAIWKTGIRIMLLNPVVGVGVMNFAEAVGTDRQARDAESLVWQAAHNSVIQIGTETGVIGLTFFLLLSLNVLRIFNRIRAESQQKELVMVAEMGLVGFVGMFTAAMFLSQAYSLYWAFYIVFSAVVSRILAKEQFDSGGLGSAVNADGRLRCSDGVSANVSEGTQPVG
jgi:O-antigen ligase